MWEFSKFTDWVSQLYVLDFMALCTFVFGTAGYKFFLAEMFRHRRQQLYIRQLQRYRCAWIDRYAMGREPIAVVQTLRNNIMIASFMASTSIILVMGSFNLLFGFDSGAISAERIFLFTSHDPYLKVVKILLLIITLLYSFFHFLWHIRELHHMTLILNVPEDQVKKITSKKPVEYLSNMFLNSGIHFSLGVRGYYFLMTLLLWMFHPALMLLSFFGILYFLIRRDLGLIARQKNM